MSQKPKIDEAYDSPPFWYDLRGLVILWLTYRTSLLRQVWFFSHLQKSHRHLEVAIGSGSFFSIVYFISMIRGLAPKHIVGLDYAPSMLVGAKRRFANLDQFTITPGDATNLEFPEGSFESVSCANAIHCIPNYPKALAEISRVLTRGGQFHVNVLMPPEGFLIGISQRINNWGIKKGILQSPIDGADFLNELKKANLRVVEMKKHGNCLMVVALKGDL